MEPIPNVFKTSMEPSDVLVRAQQFFSNEHFTANGVTERTVMFRGKPPFPWLLLLVVFVGLIFCIIPGIIAYFALFLREYKLYNLVVAVFPKSGFTEVSITCPDAQWARNMVARFVTMLTPYELDSTSGVHGMLPASTTVGSDASLE